MWIATRGSAEPYLRLALANDHSAVTERDMSNPPRSLQAFFKPHPWLGLSVTARLRLKSSSDAPPRGQTLQGPGKKRGHANLRAPGLMLNPGWTQIRDKLGRSWQEWVTDDCGRDCAQLKLGPMAGSGERGGVRRYIAPLC